MAKDEMSLKDLPKGARPEEFLTDAGLAALYERELEGLGEKNPKRPVLEASLRRAKVAAALTDQVLVPAELE